MRGRIFSNRRGSTEFEHDAETKEGKLAEERGAKKPARRAGSVLWESN